MCPIWWTNVDNESGEYFELASSICQHRDADDAAAAGLVVFSRCRLEY